MTYNQKKILLNITYYTLIGLAIIASALFILKVVFSTNLPLYIQIIYYVWSGLLISYLIFDIVCTNKKQMKFVSGIVLFVLSLLCVILAVDVFFMQGVTFRQVRNLEVTYFINMSLSFLPVYLAFFAFIFGEKIVNFKKEEI